VVSGSGWSAAGSPGHIGGVWTYTFVYPNTVAAHGHTTQLSVKVPLHPVPSSNFTVTGIAQATNAPTLSTSVTTTGLP
jgi:hypothetical protein